MTNLKVTGRFKSYDDLLTAFGTDINKEIDVDFDGFLHKIAEQDCVLSNYNALTRTFDAALLVDNPQNPGEKMQEIPFGILRRYTQNLGLNTLEDSSIVCENGDQHIFCKSCGYQVDKNIRFDYEPKFTYGDIFDGNCVANDSGNISGQIIVLNACDAEGRIFCPNCRTYEFFDEVGNTLP
jgi:hypothetical protein